MSVSKSPFLLQSQNQVVAHLILQVCSCEVCPALSRKSAAVGETSHSPGRVSLWRRAGFGSYHNLLHWLKTKTSLFSSRCLSSEVHACETNTCFPWKTQTHNPRNPLSYSIMISVPVFGGKVLESDLKAPVCVHQSFPLFLTKTFK